MTTMRSDRVTASGTEWVTKTMVFLCSCQMRRSWVWRNRRVSASRGAEGLVHEDDRGFGGERAGDRHALLHAAGQLVGPLGGEIRETDGAEIVERDVATLPLADALALEAELHVFEHRQPREERVVLKHHSPVDVRSENRLVADERPALGWLDESRQDVEECALAATGRTDQRNELSRRDVEVDGGDRFDQIARAGLIGLADTADAQALGRALGHQSTHP